MKQTNYLTPKITVVKLYDIMQVTTISGIANEDSMAPRFNEANFNTDDFWQTPFEEVHT